MRVVVTLSTALAISVAAPAFSSAADYSYRTIAASSDALSLGQCPAINNLGAVAFPASEFDPDTGDSQDLILRGSGGALTTIADEADGFTSISGNPSINDLGAVAFDGNPVGPDSELIARGSGGRLTEIARAGGTQRFDSFTARSPTRSAGPATRWRAGRCSRSPPVARCSISAARSRPR